MSRGFSVYLDALRFLAALTVAVWHLAYARFTGGSMQGFFELDAGEDAVIIFFVLSGLVIAFASERDGGAAAFAFNRATRLVSVAAPALLLTIVADGLGQRIDPETYAGWWYNPLPPAELLFRGLTFSNEWAMWPIRLGTNGPYWSLSYEAAYYALFGIAVFARGARRILLIVLVAVVAGHRILLLMPAWLIGVALWRWIRDGGPDRISRPLAVAAAAALPVGFVLARLADLPGHLMVLTGALLAPHPVLPILGFSDQALWSAVLALLVALHLAGMARLLAGHEWRAAGAIRWAAGASFSIYAVHYPLLQFFDAVLPQETPARGLALLAAALAVAFLFASLFERRLKAIRALLLRRRAAG